MANSISLDEETAKKVIRQVEFYFSDSNLPRDYFLMNCINKSQDGLVSLALICSFSRMRGHLGLEDVEPEDIPVETVESVAETLRSSSYLKISEDGQRIGRTTKFSYPEGIIEQLDAKTIAASPLPYDVRLEDVESFFAQHGKVNSVRLTHHLANKKFFSGTALIEFSSEEDATKVLEQTLFLSGRELELKPKKDFDIERTKQKEAVTVLSRCQRDSNNKKENYPKGLILAFKLKSITAETTSNENSSHELTNDDGDKEVKVQKDGVDVEQKSSEDARTEDEISQSDGTELQKYDVDTEEQKPTNDDGDKEVKVQKDGVDVEEQNPSENARTENEISQSDSMDLDSSSPDQKNEQAPVHTKEILAAMKDNKDVVLREDLKSIFQKFGKVKFLDFKMGLDSGYVRFEDAEGSRKARAFAVLADKGGLVVKNFIAILDPLQGEAEKEYWNEILNKKYTTLTDCKGKNKRYHTDSSRHRKKMRFRN